MSSAVLTLRQLKFGVGSRFGVASTVDAYYPELLRYPFVIEATSDTVDPERLVRVATLDDLNTLSYLALNAFEAPELVGLTTQDIVTATLTFDTSPDKWNGATQFMVAGKLDDDQSSAVLLITDCFPSVEAGLTWTLTQGATVVASGTTGATRRTTVPAVDELYLDNNFVSAYEFTGEALNHIVATQASVKSLVQYVAQDLVEFVSYPNPIVSTYTGE